MKTTGLKKVCIAIAVITCSMSGSLAQQFSIQSNGTARTYLVRLPQNYPVNTNYPLVIFLHGGGIQATLADTLYGFTTHAYSAGYIVVYPQGIDDSWSAPTDVPFISTLIDTLCTNYKIDKQKIYVAGHSAGAVMVHVLACNLPDKIAAFGEIAGIMTNGYKAFYRPIKAVPMLKIHGTADDVWLYQGVSGSYSSVDSVLNFWKYHNKSQTLRDSLQIADTCLTDNSSVVRYRYGEGPSEVVFYKVINGGHDSPNWAGNNEMGNTNRDISAPDVLWDFFKEHTLNNLTITYIANEGFLIAGQEKKVLIDAFFNSGFGIYLAPSSYTVNRIQQNLKPFDNVHVYMSTHNHGDHFNASVASSQLRNSNNTYFCGPQSVTSSLAGQPGYSDFSSRIVSLTPEINNFNDTVINGIKIRALRFHHDFEEYVNIGYLFEINGIKILHTGDYGGDVQFDMDTFNLIDENIDIAFINYGNFIANDEIRQAYMNKINAKHYIIMHIDQNMEQEIADIVAGYNGNPPAKVFLSSMDNMVFYRQNDSIIAQYANVSPKLIKAIPDTTARISEYFQFQIPAGTITDANLFDKIEYSATLNNGDELPDWLSFSSSSRIFTGTPVETGTIYIKVTSADKTFANVSDVFLLEIIDKLATNDIYNDDFQVYPNPSTGIFTINLPREPSKEAVIEISGIDGRSVLSQSLQNNKQFSINLSGNPKGIYMVRLIDEIVYNKMICME